MATIAKTKSKSAGSSPGVDLAELERLLGFMDKHALEEFECERDGLRIRLKKASAHPQGAVRVFPAPEIVIPGSPATPHAGATAHPASPAKEAASEAGRSEDLHIVKSPIVGTFYAS